MMVPLSFWEKRIFFKGISISKEYKKFTQIDQIKLFGIISASEESVIFMLASIILGSHHWYVLKN